MREEYFYLSWKCPGCGKDPISGELPNCPSCGHPCTVEHYDLGNQPAITDANEIKAAEAGPDWLCANCGNRNSATTFSCLDCGSTKGTKFAVREFQQPKSHSEAAEMQASPDRMSWNVDRTPEYESDHSTYSPSPVQSASQPSYEPDADMVRTNFVDQSGGGFPFAGLIKVGVAVALILGVLAIIYFAFIHRTELSGKVSGFNWSRNIDIQRLAWVNTSNRTGCPEGSRGCDKRREVVGNHQVFSHFEDVTRTVTDRVKDGETCTTTNLGNGRAKRTCRDKYKTVSKKVTERVSRYKTVDDYGDVYHYEEKQWVHSRSIPTKDVGRKAYWGEVVLATGDLPERESGRSAYYAVTYQTDEEKPRQLTKELTYEEWMAVDEYAVCIFEVNGVGTLLSVRPGPTNSKQ